MISFRALSTSTTRFARAKTSKPLIKNYPITLRFIFPPIWDKPTNHRFDSAKDIEIFLSNNKFLYDKKTNDVIRGNQTHLIDPDVLYEVAGSGVPYREKDLSRDQAWDVVFEQKTAKTLLEALKADQPNVIELPRVVKNPETGLDVSEWELIVQEPDGSITFLETKYRMSTVC